MEFDELYATHGNSACKAAETFRLRNRVSYQGMVSGFGIFTGPAAPRSQIGSASPSFRSSSRAYMPFRNLTLVYLLVILVQIGFSLTISSRRLKLAASPESCAILRRRFGTLIQIKVRSPDPGPLIPWHRRSPMTRKDTRNAIVLRGIAPLIAVLTVTIALA